MPSALQSRHKVSFLWLRRSKLHALRRACVRSSQIFSYFHPVTVLSSNPIPPHQLTHPPSEDNTNYNPMSPYTFYDITCPAELPVRKRQLSIELPLPGGINISLGLGSPKEISSACSCFITKGPAETTVTKTSSRDVTRTATVTGTVTKTAAN
jgi:hypothetical protein